MVEDFDRSVFDFEKVEVEWRKVDSNSQTKCAPLPKQLIYYNQFILLN